MPKQFFELPISANSFIRRLRLHYEEQLQSNLNTNFDHAPKDIKEPFKFGFPTHGVTWETMLATGQAWINEEGRLCLSADPKFANYGRPLEVEIVPVGTEKVEVWLEDTGRELIDEWLYDDFITFLNQFQTGESMAGWFSDDRPLSRLENGIIQACRELKANVDLDRVTDEHISTWLANKGIVNREGLSYTREHINKTKNKLINEKKLKM